MPVIQPIKAASLLFALLVLAACGTGAPEQAEENLDTQATGWFTMERNFSGQCLTAYYWNGSFFSPFPQLGMAPCRNSAEQNFKITSANRLVNRKFPGVVIGSKGGSLSMSHSQSDYSNSGATVRREQTSSFSRIKFPRLGNYCIRNASTKPCRGSYGEYWRLKNPGY